MAFYEIVGLVGVASMLLAYGAMMLGKLREGLLFHAMNLVGSLMVLYSLLHDWNLPTFVIEIAWSAVAAFGIWKVLRAARNTDRQGPTHT